MPPNCKFVFHAQADFVLFAPVHCEVKAGSQIIGCDFEQQKPRRAFTLQQAIETPRDAGLLHVSASLHVSKCGMVGFRKPNW